MPIPNATLLCHYHYDPLDRLVDCSPSAQSTTQRFYLKDRLATEIQGTAQHSIMQHDDQLLAQQQRQGGAAVETALLATDQQRSVLTLLHTNQPHAFTYAPYGHQLAGGLLSLLGFNGERPDPVTGWYLLGNGYRPFNPVLMCFTSPDSWSPFGEGGLNAYSYCEGDPVNHKDPKGHMSVKQLVALFDAKQITHSPLTISKSRARGGMPKKQNKVATNILTYEDTSSSGNLRLTIDAHGVKTPKSKEFMVHNGGNLLNPKQLYAELLSSGINIEKYDSLRLLVCDSATYGANSFAASFAKITKKPTKGYIGTVTPLKDRDLRTALGRIRLGELAKSRGDQIGSIIDKSKDYQPVKFTKKGEIA
ncbi:TPA: RHS repeat-associated core domain-containing protein [Pseudomonas putida]|nr:RHS repeat-associated core domain-containing protein [Pseudomonas putida]